MTSKFLTYWSLTFAILFIWIFSVAVALADAKDELWEKLRKQGGKKSTLRPMDPLAGRSAAETLTRPKMDAKEEWVHTQVAQVVAALRLDLKILVLQDSMDHYLVHFSRGKQLTSCRVDKAWVADAMGGKADQAERIRRAVEQHLRVEFLGEKPAPKSPPAPAAPAAQAQAPATPGRAPQAPASPTAPAPGATGESSEKTDPA